MAGAQVEGAKPERATDAWTRSRRGRAERNRLPGPVYGLLISMDRPVCMTRVVVLVERMTDDQCANYDPLGTGDPYWHRLWHRDLSPFSVSEGPTYVVAPDLTRLVQVHLALEGATPIPQIGACAIDALADEDVPDIEGVHAYVALELVFDQMPSDLEQHLERLARARAVP